MTLSNIASAPADPILGLTEAFRHDPRPDKVNLGVGVFMNEQGATPVLECIRRAERVLWETERTKNYAPISGIPEFGVEAARLALGPDFHQLAAGRVAVTQTPGGTGALRIGAELLRQFRPGAAVWLPTPTWENHKGVFTAAGCRVKEYPYYDAATRGVEPEALCQALEHVPAGDVVLLHVCCHNPTGADPDAAAWTRMGDIAARVGWLPFFDFAYQGFGDGLAEDRSSLLTMLAKVPEALVSTSLSKNMGLYGERVGALLAITETPAAAQPVLSQIKRIIRTLYSNPPRHGAALACTVLGNPELHDLWLQELEDMRLRIAGNRQRLAAGLANRLPERDFAFIVRQKGMFSFSGLTDAQVNFLREEKGVYIVKGGRINVAGLTQGTLDYVCDAIVAAMRSS